MSEKKKSDIDRLEEVCTVWDGIEVRRKEAAKLLARRVPKRRIVEQMVEQFDITPRVAYNDIQVVLKFWRTESNLFSLDDHLEHAKVLREEWIHEALAKGQVKLAWEIQKDFDTMMGLYNKDGNRDYQIVINRLPSAQCNDDDPVDEEVLESHRKLTE